MSICGAASLKTVTSGDKNSAEPSGAPIVKRRAEVAGSNGSAMSMMLRICASTSSIGLGELDGARGRNNTFRGSQEQRIVEKPPKPAKAVTDRGRREIEPRRGPADVALSQARLQTGRAD